MQRSWISAVLVLVALCEAWGTVRLPHLFSDDMVLQRNAPITVWGWADPGEAVTVTLAAKSAGATADANGAWRVVLPAMARGANLQLQVKGVNTITCNNLILGDVWVCAGQSNMEWPVKLSANADAECAAADFPTIRRIKIEYTTHAVPQEDIPPVNTANAMNRWQVCAPQTVGNFTAVGYYFAREVSRATGVPMGIIDVNWGGTYIEAWLRPADPKAPYDPTWGSAGGIGLSAIYNGMVAPLTRIPITGTLWYQGESNGTEGYSYYLKMRALIAGWRAAWQQGDFPFYYVQLANMYLDESGPAGGDGFSPTRQAQCQALDIRNTGMACTIDIGEGNNIHPRNKQDVGTRLARWALAKTYHMRGVVVSGPIYRRAKVEGRHIRISFNFVGHGLMVGKKDGLHPATADTGGVLRRFAIAGADKRFVWADAKIDGNTVVVSSPDVPHPVAVRYAYSQNPVGANLYNTDGLPAVPFRTDAW
ncbi:MAG: sialate O-acetylesterase [Armatimonadota bacterium]